MENNILRFAAIDHFIWCSVYFQIDRKDREFEHRITTALMLSHRTRIHTHSMDRNFEHLSFDSF